MLINRANFYPNLDKIFKIIKQSQFISLDLEMSGLIKGDYFRNSSIDSVLKDIFIDMILLKTKAST